MIVYLRRFTFITVCLLTPSFLAVTAAQTPAYRFASGSSSVRVPFEIANDLIVLKVRVNSSRPLQFIFDTGAGVSVIDPQSATALGLRAKGKLNLDATGGSVQSGLVGPVSLSLPGVTVFKQTLATIDLDVAAPLFGYKIDGIIGHDFINNFVVEIDYASGLMNLYETGSYKYSGAGESIPIELVEKTPFVRGRIGLNGREPIEGKFEVDTGGTGILNLNTPFVNRHKMLETLTTHTQSKMGGAGGSADAVKAHVPAVELGSLVVRNPLVVFAQGTEGSEGSTEYDGSLNDGFFSQFKTILDYSRSRIILERNQSVSTTKDLSGLEIMADPPRFRTYVVNSVAADSPAAAVGVQEEDTIVAVDGQSTSRLTLRELRRLFTQPGERVLSVRRGSKTIRLRMLLQ
ncbi:MAG TPA: aspartyl protease family protein [Pyrinomonadaceae bacterium]|nr:aspartyl protease family protein [Pyrinomonadaceae bacterium]